MNHNKPDSNTQESRKRFLSSPKEKSESKRHKDLLHGNLEDFLNVLDILEPDKTKPEVTINMATTSTNQTSGENDMLTILLRIESKLDKRVDELESKLKIKDEQISELQKKVNDLELDKKQHNVTIHGLPYKESENTSQVVIDTLKTHLNINLDDSEINDCYRLGKHDSESAEVGKPILVKFMRRKVRNEVYKAKSKLKDTNPSIFINEDLLKPKAELYAEVRKLRKDHFIWKSWTANSEIYYTLREKDEPKQITDMEDVNKIRIEITPRTPLRKTATASPNPGQN